MKSWHPIVFFLAVGALGCNQDTIMEANPRMQLGGDRIEFGAVPVGITTSRRIVVQNSGSSKLLLSSPTFDNNQDSVFFVSAYDSTIGVGGQGTIEVSFAPTQIARYEAVMVISGNDPQLPQAQIPVGGEGFRQGEIEVDPRLVDFGTINAGSIGLAQVFIRNIGNGDLIVTGIELGSETNADFDILSSTKTPATIAEDTEIPIRLAYRPGIQSTPPEEGQLLIHAADAFEPEITVSLRAALNRAPVADAGEDQDVDPLQTVTLDASLSFDPDGDLPLAYSWELARKPESSQSELVSPTEIQTRFIPDLVGVYEAELWVTDSRGLTSLLPDRVVVNAIPAQKLLIELVWDSPLADLDLHFIAPGGAFGGMYDCYYDNPQPDWGKIGFSDDDPRLIQDDLEGFGPETIGYENPIEGTFQIKVQMYSTHTTSGREPTNATLRIFVDGLLKAEMVRKLETRGQLWNVATVSWPEGTVVVQDTLE